MKRSNVITRCTCWLVIVAGVAIFSVSGFGAGPAITIVDQNGRMVPNTPSSATSQIFDVVVGPNAMPMFAPSTVTISVGDTVRWTWGSNNHSVTSGTPCTVDGQFCSPNDTNCGAGTLSNTGFVYEHTFTAAGTYSYFCHRHCSLGMTGTVNVESGSATWLASPGTGDWNTAANWTAGGPPNGSADTATFASSNITGVSLSLNTEVNGIVFNAGASPFTITASATFALTISGVGIMNNSGITQSFVAATDGNNGLINFTNSATAGNLTAFTNDGSTVSGGLGGSTAFDNSATAGSATLIANGGLHGGLGGSIDFIGSSTGGTARLKVFGNGNLDISDHDAPGVTTGSIEGSGLVFLGANNLTVGNNNLSTTFSGQIQDGGISGGTGGSLTKTGSGKLILSKTSPYTGGTTVSNGTLLVTNRSGSATGTGVVQVNKGTLAGTGIITGAVTVGTGSHSGAIVLPGNSATAPGILSIDSALIFNSRSTYKCALNRSTPIAGEITAVGVNINSGASFTFVDVGTGTLIIGTVFTVINNTSANPISGRFSNLSDGSVFTSNGNNFQASYEGGNGNDLTLTVVP
jgi:autotransporter-associated beta strand protein